MTHTPFWTLGPFQGWLRLLSLGLLPTVLGASPLRLRMGEYQGCKGGDPIARLNHDGPALPYLRALSQQVLTLFTGKRCNVKNSPFLGPGVALTGHLALQSCSLSPHSSPASLVFTSPHLQGLQAVGSTLHSQPFTLAAFSRPELIPPTTPCPIPTKESPSPSVPRQGRAGLRLPPS